MTTEDRVLELFTGANPVPDDRAIAAPMPASSYLAEIERHDRVVTIESDDGIDRQQPDDLAERRDRRPTRWIRAALLAAAVVALLVAGLIAIGARDRDEQVPASPPPVTAAASDEVVAPPLLPSADAERIPGASSTASAGLYFTDALGVPIEFTTPRDLFVVTNRAGSIELIGGVEPGTGEYLPEDGVSVTLRRWAGWSTRDEATERSPAASIDPYDIDAWIADNDVEVLSDSTGQVFGHETRIVDVRVDPSSTVRAAETAWACFAGWQPCFHYGDTEPAGRVRTEWVSAQRVTRFYLVTIDGAEPVLIEVGAAPGSDWFGEVEATVIDSLVIGANDTSG